MQCRAWIVPAPVGVVNSMTRWIDPCSAKEPGRHEIPEFIAPDMSWIQLQWWVWLTSGIAIADMTEIDATQSGDLHLPIDPANGWLNKSKYAVAPVALEFHAGEAVCQIDRLEETHCQILQFLSYLRCRPATGSRAD